METVQRPAVPTGVIPRVKSAEALQNYSPELGEVWRAKGTERNARIIVAQPSHPSVTLQWTDGDDSGLLTNAPFTLRKDTLLRDWELVAAAHPIRVKDVWQRKADGQQARVMKFEQGMNYVDMAIPTERGSLGMQIHPEILYSRWEFVGTGPVKVTQPSDSFPPNVRVEAATAELPERKHPHYFRDVSDLEWMDLYRFFTLFNVTDPCAQHAIKKLVVPGMRGGGKSTRKDIEEAIDTLQRKLEMLEEDNRAAG